MSNQRALLFVIAAVFVLSVLLSLGTGAVKLSLPEVLQGLADIRHGNQSVNGRILYYVRIPRVLAALAAGAGLSVSGVLIQTVLANPLASPGVIGINSGAGLFAAVIMAIFPMSVIFIPVAAFFGALLTALLVFGIARYTGASKITLILSGIAVSSLMSAGISTLTTLYPGIIIGMRDFQIGGFSGVNINLILPGGIIILAGLIVSLMFAGELEILGLGEETAQSLGLRVKLYRFLFIVLSAALCGAAVSFSGLIGFVGLIVPHITRLLFTGTNKRTILFASSIIGAAFLTLCDTAARTAFSPFELPVGILVSFMGAPFFLWLIFSERRRRNA